MLLSRSTDLALRTMLYVARCALDDRATTIREIAGAFRVSHEHLRKVVHRLSLGGYLRTARGRGGGLRLAMPAEKINVADIVQLMESDLSIVNCAMQRCVLEGGCSLKAALMRAQGAFLQSLRAETLADLIGERTMRGRLFRLSDRRARA